MIYQYWKIYCNTCTWIQVLLLHSPNQKYIKVLLKIWTLSPCLKFELKWYIFIYIFIYVCTVNTFFSQFDQKLGCVLYIETKFYPIFLESVSGYCRRMTADIACYASWMSVKKKTNLSEILYSEFNFHVLEYLSTQTTVSGIKQVLGSVFPIM